MAMTDYEKTALLTDSAYVGLFTAAPSDAGGGTEVSGAGYARQAVSFTLAGDTAVSNSAVQLANTGADWPQVGWAGLFDAATSGHLIQWVAITPFTLLSGRTYTISAGDIEVDF